MMAFAGVQTSEEDIGALYWGFQGRPGEFTVRPSGSGTANSIPVTNTMENALAVENRARKPERIDVHGLLGPATLRPYLEAELKCVAK